MTDGTLSLHKIADRLFDLAESEAAMSTLHAIEAYKAAADVLQMAEHSGIHRLFRDVMAAPVEHADIPDPCEACGHDHMGADDCSAVVRTDNGIGRCGCKGVA